MKELAGKVAVITGAASGIGLATVRALGHEGMSVIMADVNEAALKEAADGCTADGLTVRPFATDVSDFTAMQRLADASYDAFGAVHLLHLNAGIGGGVSLFDAETANWDRIIGVNLLGVVWGIKAFVPRMREVGAEALILATSSGAGAEGNSYRSVGYAATKLAVVSVMESLYGSLAAEKSPVSAAIVFPPLTATSLNGAPANMKFVEQFLQSEGVPAMLVKPEQVASMIVDGIKRGRFFIRMGEEENTRFYEGSHGAEFFAWSERVITGRSRAQLSDGDPHDYLW